MSPRVSVIMPVYKAERFLNQALRSLLDQTFTDFELIVVNDGSPDNSEKIILGINDRRIKYLKNVSNEGLVSSLNKGISMSTGEFIARMDADDVCHIQRFEKQVSYLDSHPEVDLVATRLVLINENGDEFGHWPEDYQGTDRHSISRLLPAKNCIGHPTVMFRRSSLGALRYDKRLPDSEDWGLWLDMLANGSVLEKINETLLQYRVHTGSVTVTANKNNLRRKVRRFKQVYFATRLFSQRAAMALRVYATRLSDAYVRPLKDVARPMYQFLRNNPVLVLAQMRAVNKILDRNPVSLIFIFPYYHMGGAEKVHASIIESVSETPSITILTRRSRDQHFKKAFENSSTVVEAGALCRVDAAKRWLLRKLSAYAGKHNGITFFSSNSQFFYQLIPHLPATARKIDLIHAFVGFTEQGPERWSLPVAHAITSRVVINRKTASDLAQIYKVHGISSNLVDRIVYIANYTNLEARNEKNWSGELNVLYAGRGGEEKRLYLISAIHSLTRASSPPINFHFAGNVSGYLNEGDLKGATFYGHISDEERLLELYSNTHILILTSSREGFPMSIMEAMACGVVPFSTSVGGIPEHVHHLDNGFLVHSGNEDVIVHELAGALQKYNADRVALRGMSERARSYARQNFSRDKFITSYRKLLINK